MSRQAPKQPSFYQTPNWIKTVARNCSRTTPLRPLCAYRLRPLSMLVSKQPSLFSQQVFLTLNINWWKVSISKKTVLKPSRIKDATTLTAFGKMTMRIIGLLRSLTTTTNAMEHISKLTQPNAYLIQTLKYRLSSTWKIS